MQLIIVFISQVLYHQSSKHQSRCQTRCQAKAQQDFRAKPKNNVRVLVAGSTGYIGKYVTKELISRGYDVVAFAREKSGVGGKTLKEQTQQVTSTCMVLMSVCVTSNQMQFQLYMHSWLHLIINACVCMSIV